MIRRPPRSTQSRSSAASDVYKRQKHEFAMYDRYWLDFGALKEALTQMRLILAAGEAQREAFPYRSAAAVADRLGIALTEFPGGHVGYITHPRAFAARLLDVLGAEPGR